MKKLVILSAFIFLGLNSIASAQNCDDLGTYGNVDVRVCIGGGTLKMFAYNNNNYRVEMQVKGCNIYYANGTISKFSPMSTTDHIRPHSEMGAWHMEDVGNRAYELRDCRVYVNKY